MEHIKLDKFITFELLTVLLRRVVWYILVPNKLHDITFQKTMILTVIN
jgi:hypothetical protein